MDFLQKIAVIWQNLNIVHKAVLISLALAFVFAGTMLTQWATKPEMRMLFQGIDIGEAAKIAEKIAVNNTSIAIMPG